MGKGEGQERGESRPWRSSRRTLVCPPVLLASGAAHQRLSPSLAQEAGVESEQGARTPTGRPAVGPGPVLDVTSDEMSKVQMRGVLTGFPKAGGEARSVAPPDPTFSCTCHQGPVSDWRATGPSYPGDSVSVCRPPRDTDTLLPLLPGPRGRPPGSAVQRRHKPWLHAHPHLTAVRVP